MAQIHRLHTQAELKNCSADQVYGFFKNEMTKLPLLLPLIYKDLQILAGDGNSVGSIRLAKIAMGTSQLVSIADKIEAVDDESRSLSFCITDGDLLRMYTKFAYKLTVAPGGDKQRCLAKWSVELSKLSLEK
ncbi:MLP-like protein 423 [Papaver somniferum]|uniref:MLP-like protein 423 n=1 Tax=Papaver somniferum TaxID=3469 RepID=UPI000E6FE156|nr:MLP-like protein 423 [Papaver somniferum]